LQRQPIDAFLSACKDPSKMGGIISLSCGGGKCLARDTPLIMINGDTKMVQYVQVGDMLMGDDSQGREVVSTCRGSEALYCIVPHSPLFDSYVVNESHILTLKNSFGCCDVPLSQFLKLDEQQKKEYKGFACTVSSFGCNTNTNFAKQQVCVNEIATELLTVCYNYNICENSVERLDHLLYNLNSLKCSDLKTRRSFIDAIVGAVDNNSFSFEPEYELYYYDVCCNICRIVEFIARSVGIRTVNCDTSIIFDESGTSTYDFHIEPMGHGEYYGFEVIGNNRRFLLGDFTVTHNTVLGLYAIHSLKKKSMIIVHKDFLLSQWKERIEQFLPSARVGLIKAKTLDVVDKDIIIASLQSLSMKDYDPSIFSDIGFVIIDEVHRTGTEVFSSALHKINFKYALGLSATVQRKDGMTKVFKWFIGDVIYNKKRTADNVIAAVCQYYNKDTDYCKEEMIFNGKLNLSKMINNVCDYLPRSEFIVRLIVKAIRESKMTRKVLVLSDRKAHLATIKALLDKISNETITSGFYIGGMKPLALKESESKQVILATFSFASEGFDAKNLDTLVLASPKTDIEQSVGRILREKESDRKNIPVIFDVMDMFSVFERQGEKRKKYYKKLKYVIKMSSSECDGIDLIDEECRINENNGNHADDEDDDDCGEGADVCRAEKTTVSTTPKKGKKISASLKPGQCIILED